jgi:hypothetical protein
MLSTFYSCENSDYIYPYLFAYMGINVVATNILCHRYLIEKARIITAM